jgi:uncharacterized protein (TIGR03437 family)
VPAEVRTEGLAERIGDIVLQCSGSNPGAVFSGNLAVFLPVSVTNRVNSNNITADANLDVDYGSGYASAGAVAMVNGQSVGFNGFRITVPPNRAFTLRISGIRIAANRLPPAASPSPVQAMLSAPFPVNQVQLNVAFAQTGLYTNVNSAYIVCAGSPLPGVITFGNLLAAGTTFSSTRVTEGFPGSFVPPQPGADSGTRFLLRYTGVPAGARLLLPDLVAGSTALTPTAAGDLGGTPSGGRYEPGSGTLLLARVIGPDPTGAGGTVVTLPSGPDPVSLEGVTEAPLQNGAGFAVYEVVDGNAAVRETAQFPVFVAMPRVTSEITADATQRLTFAPVSNDDTASATAPVPRFADIAPALDCGVLGDCGASYFPKLGLEYYPVQFSVPAGERLDTTMGVWVRNLGGGVLNWAVSFAYENGSGWLAVDYASGVNAGYFRIFVKPQGLAPGVYRGSVVVNGGTFGGPQNIPITLTILPAAGGPAAAAPVPAVSSVVNAATFEATPLVPGSLGALFGSNLAGAKLTLAFDGIPAGVLYAGKDQVYFQVPAALAGEPAADLVVTVDGASSAPRSVTLSPAWPSVFAHGVLNQDNSPNSEEFAEAAGRVLQVFVTGIPENASVLVQIAGRQGLVPQYAGVAPGLMGMQQVNVAVPDGAGSGAAPMVICATAGGREYCSKSYAIHVR